MTFRDPTSKLVFDGLSFDEPDPRLFAVGPGYQELPPSQSTLKHLRYGHVPEPNVSQIVKNLAKSDAHYSSNRVAAP